MPLSNATLKSTLNNKEFYTDQNGYFDFGFAQGEHDFLINNEYIVTIAFTAYESTFYNFYIGETLTLGDINIDGVVNILDVILVVNFILETSYPTNEEIWSSDLNEDSSINIQDIILIINIILN